MDESGNELEWRKRLRSLVWNDFTKERKPDGNFVAICNHCKKNFSISGRTGTTHLKNHLASCLNPNSHKRRKLAIKRQISKDETSDVSLFNQELCSQNLAKMILLHGYPLAIAQDVGFKTFVKNLQPMFNFTSDEDVKANCMKVYESGRIKLYEFLEKLSSRVSFTVDMRRSSRDLDYVCLTCHYINDDWELEKKILNFLYVETPTTSEVISKTIAEKLIDWNLDKKLFSVILDNCNESDAVAKELSELVPLKGEFFHLQTAVSVLNAIAQDVTRLVNDIITRVRESVQYVISSQATLDAFHIAARKAGAPQKELVSNDENSWLTTYLMLEAACESKAAFTHLAECDSGYTKSLSSEEWDTVKAVFECLYVFYYAMDKLSGAKLSTSNLCFNDICGIHLLLNTWRKSNFPVIAAMASQILENFEMYWGTMLPFMAIASVLDPRYKLKSIEYFFNEIYNGTDETNVRIENIRKHMVSLYNEYTVQSINTANSIAFLSDGSSTEPKASTESKTSSRMLFDAQLGLDQYLQETSENQSQKSDLDLYLDEAVYYYPGSEDNFNILAWWKFHSAKYPVLSAMAREILGIPISIPVTESESRVLNPNWSFLDPATVQGLICGQDWLSNEFEERRGPVDEVTDVPLALNLVADVDECMMSANEDEFFHQNRDCN